MQFKDMPGLWPEILQAVERMGFSEMTEVQEKTLPVMLSGRDVIAKAPTGTGKTCAFGIPLVQRIDPARAVPQAVVLAPTRELAQQIAGDLEDLAHFLPEIRVACVYGGADMQKQINRLKKGCQIVVATPGRLMDHMRHKSIDTRAVESVVLDEADEMLNMGFREDIEMILKDTPVQRQTVMFSATMPREIMEIAKTYMREPVIVKVVKKELTVPKIEQYYYEVKAKNKLEVLCRLLDMYAPRLSLVFCNTKRQVDELVPELQGRGYFAEGLHGDMKQSLRDRVMAGFRNGATEILVATDVAARGIDVDDVEAVFNYDIPQDEEYYVHRIGRTGRAGRNGKAFSLAVGREIYKLKDIMRYCRTKILARPVPSLNDVAQVKIEKTLDRMSGIIEDHNLDYYIRMIEERINKEDYTAMDLAAAFLKAAVRGDEEAEERETDQLAETDGEGEMVRLFLNIGKRQNIRPGDILGAIAGEADIPGKAVGSIEMYDKFSFVEVPYRYVSNVLGAMRHAKIKGKTVNVEPAETEASPRLIRGKDFTRLKIR